MLRRNFDVNTPPSRTTVESHLMMPLTPPTDARNVSDDRGVLERDLDERKEQEVLYETTKEGDVRTIVVEPSFDNIESSKADNPAMMSPDRREGAPDESPVAAVAGVMSRGRGHSRNLSAQFHKGLRVSDEHGRYPVQRSTRMDDPSDLSPHVKTDLSKPLDATIPSPGQDPAIEHPAMSPATGRKHHRGYSEDMSYPSHAHRRMNSSGNSVQIDRSAYSQDRSGYAVPRHAHHRKTSSGLDILHAVAAGISKEDLAVAAGAEEPTDTMTTTTTPWEPPSSETHQLPRRSPVETQPRMSPSAISAGSYEHYSRPPAGPPPPRYGPSQQQPRPPHGYQGPPPPSYRGPPPAYATPAPFYGQPHHPYHSRVMAQGPYPVQYAPTSRAYKGSFAPPPPPPQQPVFPESSGTPPTPPERPASGNGVTTGAQTMVTAIDIGGNRVMRAAPLTRTASTNTEPEVQPPSSSAPIPTSVSHHRRHSSFGSLSTMLGSSAFPEVPGAPAKPPVNYTGEEQSGSHHRSNTSTSLSFLLDDQKRPGHHRPTSSTVSFLKYLEDQPLSNEAFLQAVAAPDQAAAYPPHSLGPHSPRPGYSYPPQAQIQDPSPPQFKPEPVAEHSGAACKLASGGTSKRVRRKCTVEGCTNRTVQGGLCISHGAKRKQCKHPGCTKNVKKAGLCSAHGPARKRCEHEGCSKVAVQGGRCIAHGAKKKLCVVDNCTKQAILSGMCKKHHDEQKLKAQQQAAPGLVAPPVPAASASAPQHRPTHTRGLSIFQEINPEAMQDLLNPTAPTPGSY